MKIPYPLLRAWDRFEAWINVPVWYWHRQRFEVRRIDIMLTVFGIFCVAYYTYYDGIRGALIGGLMYIMMVMVSVWIL